MDEGKSGFAWFVDVVQYLVLAGVVVFVLALFLNDGSSPPPASAGAAADPGAEVFAANCARCHGADGGGGLGPQLSGGAVVEAYPDIADEIVVITDGRGGMPAFGGSLSPEEIQAVAQYTRGL